MAERETNADAAIAARLNAATPDSPNRINAQELKEWADEYLRDYDGELARFPAQAGRPHWNLWMRDARPEDALFAVLIFREGTLEFFCGTGDASAVRRFAESHPADSPGALFAEMSERFTIPEGGCQLGRQAAEKWLSRAW